MSPLRYNPAVRSQKPRQSIKKLLLFVALLLGVVGGYAVVHGRQESKKVASSSEIHVRTTPLGTGSNQIVPLPNHCADNTLGQLALISISQRHMWACEKSVTIYDSPVITGMQNRAADLTPTGTYHIYAKQTDLTLRGSDSTGSWSDPVSYWMPFLENQYGVYGFHDATWRPDSEFGTIDPNSSQGSHGCIELPLATAKWLYDWSQVGTTVTVVS